MNRLSTKKFFITLTISLVALIMAACGNQRPSTNVERLDHKSDRELENALFEQNKIPFDFMNVRIGVEIESPAQNASFSCYVKLDVDSLIGGTIKAAVVVYGTFKVSRDSIIFAKKLEKCYFAETLDYVSTLFGTSLDFDFFQGMILGLPVGLEENTKYDQIREKDQDHYILSSHKKRDFVKLEQNKLDPNEEMLIQYHMRPDLELFEIDVEIPSDTTSIKVNFSERKEVDGFKVPEETVIHIQNAGDTIIIRLNYGSVKLNENSDININIPDSYIECN